MGDDVLERLRRANPLPDGLPAPPLEPLLDQLEQPPTRSTERRLSNVLAPVLGIAVVMLVAAAALLTVGRQQPRPTATGSIPTAARQLVAELGVLRRRQTPADRNLPAAVLDEQPGTVRSLTRLALHVGDMRVFVIVSVPRSSARAGVSVVAVTRTGGVFWLDNVAAPFVRRPRPPAPSGPALVPIHVSIVPDGVAAVAWALRPLSPHAHVTAVHAAVRSNLAIVRFTQPEELASRVTWYAASGRPIAVYNAPAEQARQLRADQSAIAASDDRPIARSLLAHFKLFRSPKSPMTGPALPIGIAAEYATQRGGLNVGLARFVAVSDTEPPTEGYPHGVWVIPGSRTLCFEDTEFAGGCSSSLTGRGSPESGSLSMTSADNGTYWITGIVPDGNPTVLLKLSDGTTKTVGVIDNVYSLATKTRAIALTAKNATGRMITIEL